ncbi:class I SAM-dependent rRNA methyltransferase [Sulfoacidibacillus thermotolerans]|uniref:rRNA large subunit methyltransferase I n=1 Tax=Sulfoacidibacillus thermotolerans TaxID=1765684 RepID=A0A2U3D7B5_SULT2|nr:class I SAM-dependent rRNA methyltransferase [Sulfoacidibacillus thermotolerans]PWI57168.1 rRNA large subunit methyltransferase I [Sulfoacidibacillus thermotolerans]
MAQILLKRVRKRRLEQGHPWVYRNEIEEVQGEPEAGAVVVVKNHQGHDLALGFWHPTSQIAVRIASYQTSERIDRTWLKAKIARAWAYRKRFLAHTEACRAVYGEADGIPGLIVDKYGEVAVIQILSLAMDIRRDWIVPALHEVLGVRAIYERSDAPVRRLEGLEPQVGCVFGECPEEVEIKENGIFFLVDIQEGQKTGHFFDQRENRAALAPVVRFGALEKPRPDLRFREEWTDKVVVPESHNTRVGAEVLDCFSHTGAFALHAVRYGAKHVILVDASERALQQAKRNAERNGYSERCEFVMGNAFDLLREYERNERLFDVVILDPPAFAKNRAAVPSALRGYKEINLRGLKLVRPGGFLVTASCSAHVSPDQWRGIVAEAALDARKILRLVEYRSAAKDHPQLMGMEENDYLKFAIFEVQPR